MQYAAALTQATPSAAPSGLRLELIHRAEAHAPPRGHENGSPHSTSQSRTTAR